MSEIRANTVSDAAGTGPVTLTKQSAAKAWATVNMSGTAAISDSFNFTSLTDNGTGDYTATFTSAMANGNYAANASNDRSGTVGASQSNAYQRNVADVRCINANSAGSVADFTKNSVTAHGDLA